MWKSKIVNWVASSKYGALQEVGFCNKDMSDEDIYPEHAVRLTRNPDTDWNASNTTFAERLQIRISDTNYDESVGTYAYSQNMMLKTDLKITSSKVAVNVEKAGSTVYSEESTYVPDSANLQYLFFRLFYGNIENYAFEWKESEYLRRYGMRDNGNSILDDYLDWMFLAKYVDPEPAHGSWGSEETIGGVTYEVNVDAVVQSHATITKETIFNVEKDAAVSGQSLTAQEVGFNVVRDALVQASVAMQVLGVYPFNVEALVGASADAQFRQTLGISRDAAVAVVSTPLFQSMFNVGSDAVLRVVAEVGVVKEGEVKVTRVFLVLGDLAIQLTGD